MKQNYLHRMVEFGLLPRSGLALDLGSGVGADAIFLADRGLDVTAIDTEPQTISHRGVTFSINDVSMFHIEPGKYSVIIARNILPFFSDKEKVKKILNDMVRGLTDNGALYFTVFGQKDEWFGRATMSFFTESEIDAVVKDLPIHIFEKNVTEGLGRTMSEGIKYWNVFSYICTKKTLSNIKADFHQTR